jgi:hypothetical protein
MQIFPFKEAILKDCTSYIIIKIRVIIPIFSNLNTTEINMIELGISKNFGEKKFFFCPRFGIGNAVVDIKTLIEDTTSEINYSLEKKYRVSKFVDGVF